MCAGTLKANSQVELSRERVPRLSGLGRGCGESGTGKPVQYQTLNRKQRGGLPHLLGVEVTFQVRLPHVCARPAHARAQGLTLVPISAQLELFCPPYYPQLHP